MHTPAVLARDAEWLPYRIDLSRGLIHFVHLTRADHRNLPFLGDEYIDAGIPRAVKPIRHIASAIQSDPTARCHLVFHSAFCCSTLLARALDVEGYVMGLKEPGALMQLSEAGLATGDLARVRPHLQLLLMLLARPFGSREAVIIKPTNIVNPMAAEILAVRPEARALLLYSPLSEFLLSVANKGLFGRIWARKSLASHGRMPAFDPGFSEWDRSLHTDLQVAALGWLQQQAQFARLITTQPAGRVLTLDSGTLLARRSDTLMALDRLFQLGVPKDQIATIAGGPVFARHAKRPSEPFDEAQRVDDQAEAKQAYGNEIEMVLKWAEAVAAYVGVPMRLGAPLLCD